MKYDLKFVAVVALIVLGVNLVMDYLRNRGLIFISSTGSLPSTSTLTGDDLQDYILKTHPNAK